MSLNGSLQRLAEMQPIELSRKVRMAVERTVCIVVTADLSREVIVCHD